MTWAHTGEYLITHFLHMPVNNPADAIIHVAIFINTFMRTAVKLGVMGQMHQHLILLSRVCLFMTASLLFKRAPH